MKIKQRKMIAFITTWLTLIILAIMTIFFAPESWGEYGKLTVIGLLGNAVGFISFTVIKDFIRSKYYKKELDDNYNEKND